MHEELSHLFEKRGALLIQKLFGANQFQEKWIIKSMIWIGLTIKNTLKSTETFVLHFIGRYYCCQFDGT